MNRFEMRVDPLTHEIYYDVSMRGRALLFDPLLNKDRAFPHDERADFNLIGLLPDTIGTLEDQVTRNYESYLSKPNDLEKYVFLLSLLDRNETIFYALVTQHTEEMLPIVYTPTVGLACLKLSHIIRRYRGIYVTPQNVNGIEQILQNVGLPNVSLIVVTDGERILGFGDLGADGMGIPVGKLALYVAGAGIHPASTLPVCIDVGTNTERLLNDPLYIGVRSPRLTGQAYYDVIERFVQGIRRVFPRALLQWEDFGKGNAFNLLKNYQNRILSFNDDIQGTGSIATAALATALKIKKGPLAKERIAIYGFGQAGSGIANSIVTLIQKEEGISLEEARKKIYAVDINGLMLEGDKAEEYQKDFLHSKASIADWPIDKTRPPQLDEVIEHAKITILIGVSAQPGVFSEKMLSQMAANTDRPIVFALSNPTSKCETTPQAAMAATKGKALMATGSPFAPVETPDGKKIHISQCNNMYVFPGVGLGSIVCQATKVTPSMFYAASQAVSDSVTDKQRAEGYLLPHLEDIRNVSFNVALAVAKQARTEGLGMNLSDDRLADLIKKAMWKPHYYPYRLRQNS
jgi:malate dehydrogenase (oxaloacetate-decarboxylating)